MRITKRERINGSQVRCLCIRFNLYTNGTNEEYNNLLENLCGGYYEGIENPTVGQIQKIAEDIIEHSGVPTGIDYHDYLLNVMCLLGEYTIISYDVV